ncbi:MAG: type I-F CRISPR-associated endoribonuclease Cas6/Csy4 [SAR86 cluster bacterium]|uniref:Type I-F CRISPR-associated endoribonuclease Cas6/Csy4 n=1 Tax=SAR86 cluster bacterium TaxID=2030880 RepID=A0A2A5C6M6_9GAMM|nr:MAG: type I-F CRISPR-associated endoribonuclease Cas6/Csy4 [SAR86 cluster bacterium]
MKHYLDITLLPDAEANLGFIWQKVFQQIHIALAENKLPNGNSAIAVSFPEYSDKFPLGSKLRLFSPTVEILEQLNVNQWLNRLSDYTHCTSIKEVPESVAHTRFKRKQFTTNPHRLARRRVKRKGGTLEEALQYYATFEDKESKLPFINMNSLSGESKFRLFIDKEEAAEPVQGEFNCYGLSKTATVPWF